MSTPGPLGTAALAAAAKPAGRATKRLIGVVSVVVLLCLLCVGGATLSLLNDLTNPAPADITGCGSGAAVDPNGQLPAVSGLTDQQIRMAAVIIQVGQKLKVPARGWVIGVATALQESRLTNLPFLGANNDHDSLGLFQQRPSAGWGTVEQLSDPAYQARKFFEKLVKIGGWETLPLTVAAQRVQISAYPDAYAKHEPLASQVVDRLTGGASRSSIVEVALRCTAVGEISASGWTVPVKATIVSGFRGPGRPFHDGVDLAVPKGTVVHAAAAGVVLVATCNAHVGSTPYSCDRDGGIFVTGCGWYVDILHAGNVITRYCHMVQRPSVVVGEAVTAGQQIGLSGSSGNSTGPHVHFEVHLNGDSGSSGAVDPVPFMAQAGAPLSGSQA